MVRLERFSKSYGQVKAVRDLDLAVLEGEVFVLLGSNGSGKSTLLRAIAGLHSPSSGRVLVGGRDVAESPLEAKRIMAYLPQRLEFPAVLTGREILRFYAGLRGSAAERVRETLDFVGLGEHADRPVGGYSGGMLQRLALGIARLEDVSLLLLDEPTLNLDPRGMRRLREWIESARARGATVILTSHVLEESLRLADRVGVMAQGRLVRVLDVEEFGARVVLATSVRVVVDGLAESMVEAVEKAGGQAVRCEDRSLWFKASPEDRRKVIRALEEAGASIEALHTEPPDWTELVEILTSSGGGR